MRPKVIRPPVTGLGEIRPPPPARPAPGDTLIIDIETSPIEGYVWGTWKQNLSVEQIKSDWSILSYAAKWADESKVFYQDTGGRGVDKVRDDSILLPGLWKLLDEADRIVAQNGARFDVKKINWRFAVTGYEPPSAFRIYDTLLASRRLFAATSHKLAWLSEKLTDTPKSKHRKYPGWELWLECLKDNPAAWAEMKKYNIQDIRATEKVWKRQQSFIRNRAMLGTYDKQA
jgi:uncharacterized protein YprB with RNaseH-like and TPR domain